MILKAAMQTVGDKTVISGLRWSATGRYRLITVNDVVCVGGDFSQTDSKSVVFVRSNDTPHWTAL